MLVDYKNISIYQQETCILHNVNFHLEEGEFIYLIGRVGSGKSSLLKTIYGEFSLHDGEGEVLGYKLNGIKRNKLQELRRQIGIIFQDFQLLNDRTVEENLRFVLKATGWKKKEEIKARITEVLELVGMTNKGYKMPNELSGGEQQRIVIARAILNRPKIILADEPTGNLDIDTSRKILELLQHISETGSAVIMSTHNLALMSSFPGIVYRCKDNEVTEITQEFNKPFDMDEMSILEKAENAEESNRPLSDENGEDDDAAADEQSAAPLDLSEE